MDTIPLLRIIVAGVVVLVPLALAAWLFTQYKKGSGRLQPRFGPEYRRTAGKPGGRTKAASELATGEERVEHVTITPLAPEEAAKFSQGLAPGPVRR
jgi:hypothetical protein